MTFLGIATASIAIVATGLFVDKMLTKLRLARLRREEARRQRDRAYWEAYYDRLIHEQQAADRDLEAQGFHRHSFRHPDEWRNIVESYPQLTGTLIYTDRDRDGYYFFHNIEELAPTPKYKPKKIVRNLPEWW